MLQRKIKQANKDRLVRVDCLIERDQDTLYKGKAVNFHNMIKMSWESKMREKR